MSIVRTLKNRRSSARPSRTRRDLARALASAPTQASRDELYLLANR